MKRYLEENHFDVIFMTHMYPAHVLTALRKKGTALPATIQIATDYTCIPFLEEGICDYYVIPSAELSEEFTVRGIPAEKLLPFGIPVNRKFTLSFSPARSQKKAGTSGKGPLLSACRRQHRRRKHSAGGRYSAHVSGGRRKRHARHSLREKDGDCTKGSAKSITPTAGFWFWKARRAWRSICAPAIFFSPSRAAFPPRKPPFPACR